MAVVCGPHRQGTQVVCCGRQLANHGVKVLLLRLPGERDAPEDPLLPSELALFRTSGGKEHTALTGTHLSSSLREPVVRLQGWAYWGELLQPGTTYYTVQVGEPMSETTGIKE